MSWLERELSWDVPATELRHLTGRIGELYAALITNGRMATEVNQAGYDVQASVYQLKQQVGCIQAAILALILIR